MGPTAQSFSMLSQTFQKGERPLFSSLTICLLHMESETCPATEQMALSEHAEEQFYLKK